MNYHRVKKALESLGFEIVEGDNPMLVELHKKFFYVWPKREYWRPKGIGGKEYHYTSVEDLHNQIITGVYGQIRYEPTPHNILKGLATLSPKHISYPLDTQLLTIKEKAIPEIKVPGIVYFDGSCIKNPGGRGQGAAIVTILNKETKPQDYKTTKLLESTTNNVAEFTGLIIGLEKALELGCTHVKLFGDSDLIIKQVKGEWKVKKEHLKPLCEEARQLLNSIYDWELTWVPRNKNTKADALSKIK